MRGLRRGTPAPDLEQGLGCHAEVPAWRFPGTTSPLRASLGHEGNKETKTNDQPAPAAR